MERDIKVAARTFWVPIGEMAISTVGGIEATTSRGAIGFLGGLALSWVSATAVVQAWPKAWNRWDYLKTAESPPKTVSDDEK